MNHQLEPQRVEISDIRNWLTESMAIFRRSPVLFLSLALIFFVVCYKLKLNSYLTFLIGLVLCQVCLVLTIEFARTLDESKPVSLNRCYTALQNSVLTIVLFALFYVLMWVVAVKLASLLMFEELFAEVAAPPSINFLQWLYPGTDALFVVYLGVMVTTMWFLLPLAAFYKLGFIELLRLARRGERLNTPVVIVASYTPFFIFFLLFVVSEVALLVAVPCMPLLGIYLYVAYRHVYLGRRDNLPAAVKEVVAETRAV